jgi:hypothetical protein
MALLSRLVADWGWAALLVAALTVEEAHEYCLAFLLLFAAAVSLVAICIHWKGIDESPSLTIAVRVLGLIFSLVMATVGPLWIWYNMGDQPCSRVPSAWNKLIDYRSPIAPFMSGRTTTAPSPNKSAYEHTSRAALKELQKELAKLKIVPSAIDREISSIRSESISLINRLYGSLNVFNREDDGYKSQPKELKLATEAERKRLLVEFGKAYQKDYAKLVADLYVTLMGHIQQPPPPRYGDRERIYQVIYLPNGGLLPQVVEDQLFDLCILLNEMERENNLPLSCSNLKLR